MKAIWNNTVIAESNSTIIIENNHYFPPSSVNSAFLKPSETTIVCPWKGEASYYTIKVNECYHNYSVILTPFQKAI